MSAAIADNLNPGSPSGRVRQNTRPNTPLASRKPGASPPAPKSPPVSQSADRVALTGGPAPLRINSTLAVFLVIVGIGVIRSVVINRNKAHVQQAAMQKRIADFDRTLSTGAFFAAAAKADPVAYQKFLDQQHAVLRSHPPDEQQTIRQNGIAFVQKELNDHLQRATPHTVKMWGQYRLDVLNDWYAESPDTLFTAFTTGLENTPPPPGLAAKMADQTSAESRECAAIVAAPLADHPIDYSHQLHPTIAQLAVGMPADEIKALLDKHDRREPDKTAYVKAMLYLFAHVLNLPDEQAAAYLLSSNLSPK